MTHSKLSSRFSIFALKGRKVTPDQEKGVSHDGYVNGLRFTDDGLFLVTFGRDGKIRKWNVSSGQNMKAKLPKFQNTRRCGVPFDLAGDFLAIPTGTRNRLVSHFMILSDDRFL